jgi:hypothetical protein
VLPLGPLTLPAGRPHSACPRQRAAWEQREAAAVAQRSRREAAEGAAAAAAAAGAEAAGAGAGAGAGGGAAATGRPSAEAEWARHWRRWGEARSRKQWAQAEGGDGATALQQWRAERAGGGGSGGAAGSGGGL